MNMELKKLAAVCFAALFFTGCALSEPESGVTLTTTENIPADTSAANAETEETRPPCGLGAELRSFTSVRSMFEALKDDADSAFDLDSLRELHGLGDGYSESWIEWAGGPEYCVYYANETFAIAFMPFTTEEALRTSMDAQLSASGTYESLEANPRVANLRKSPLETPYGAAYECAYDTSVSGGFRLRYYEYTAPSGVTYILSQGFNPDGSVRHNDLFVFDGSNSFSCGTADPELTFQIGLGLTSEPLM